MQPFIDAFTSFQKVVEACFGKVLLDDFEARIHSFEEAHRKLDIPVTPKVHILIFTFYSFAINSGEGVEYTVNKHLSLLIMTSIRFGKSTKSTETIQNLDLAY